MSWSKDVAIRTVWMEARGEGQDGMRAVAHVLVNRLKDGRWGNTLAQVCQASAQFSCWSTRDPNLHACNLQPEDLPLFVQIGEWLDAALAGEEPDPTYGATHYYATSMINPPYWTATAKLTVVINHHRFYKGVQ